MKLIDYQEFKTRWTDRGGNLLHINDEVIETYQTNSLIKEYVMAFVH